MTNKIYLTYIFIKIWLKQFKKISFLSKKINYSQLKIIISSPRSGTHYLEGLINSYLEQLYKKGNGSLKYSKGSALRFNTPDNLIFSVKQLFDRNFFNQFRFNDYRYFSFVHHPLHKSEILNINLIKPIILIRNPTDIIASLVVFYIRHRIKNTIVSNHVLKKIINKKSDQIIDFFNFWDAKIQLRKTKEQLIIKYEDLNKNPKIILIKILKFYNFKIINKFINHAVKQNSKKNILNLLKKNKDIDNYLQFTSKSQNKLKSKIKKITKKKLSEIKFHKFGYDYKK
jgi:hypothetical protein